MAASHRMPIGVRLVGHATSAPASRFASVHSPSANVARNALVPMRRRRAAYTFRSGLYRTSARGGMCFPELEMSGAPPLFFLLFVT